MYTYAYDASNPLGFSTHFASTVWNHSRHPTCRNADPLFTYIFVFRLELSSFLVIFRPVSLAFIFLHHLLSFVISI